jgi:uncharacterized coiled-coil protein SlyX
MTEERLERIENQLDQVLQALTGVNTRLTTFEQNLNAAREDIRVLRNRIDSVEGTIRMAISDGFKSHDAYLNDLNVDFHDRKAGSTADPPNGTVGANKRSLII